MIAKNLMEMEALENLLHEIEFDFEIENLEDVITPGCGLGCPC